MEFSEATADDAELLRQMPPRMKDALHNARVDFRQVAKMDLGDLMKIRGIGPRMVEIYAERSGRLDEWMSHPENEDGYVIVKDDETGDAVKVPVSAIKMYRRKRETFEHFGIWVDYTKETYPERYWDQWHRLKDGVSDEEVAKYIYNVGKQAKITATKGENEDDEIPVLKETTRPKSNAPARVDVLKAEFMEELHRTYDLDDAPINDRENARHLSVLMARRALFDDELMTIIREKEEAEDILKVTSSDRVQTLEKAIAALDRQISDREKALQIGPRERAAAQGATQASDVIKELIANTMELRKRLVVHVQANGVLMGFIVWHFPDHTPVCADCGGEHFIVESPLGDIVDVEFVTQKARDLYARSADFLPYPVPSTSPLIDSETYRNNKGLRKSRNGRQETTPSPRQKVTPKPRRKVTKKRK